MKTDDVAIKVSNLSKKYVLNKKGKDAELWALKDVSFEIKRGATIGVIGPNGSGKSTLLKILAGVTKPTHGKVEIYGRIASILDIGAGFNPELSGKDNIFLNGQILGFSKKEIAQKLNEIIEFSGISSFINQPVKSYSNGMYLRLAFSIIAHLDFDIYLFDEVMSVGDAEFSIKSLSVIKMLTQSDKTILFVSHNLNELQDKSEILYFEGGQLQDIDDDNNVLSDYIEKKLTKLNKKIVSKNIEINDFSNYKKCTEFALKKICFYQNERESDQVFSTKNEFILELEYEKFKNEGTLDVVLKFSDYNGIPIFSSAPFIYGDFNSETGSKIYNLQCKIMPNLFHSQIYKLSLIFIKNANSSIANPIKNKKSSELHAWEKGVEVVQMFDDVIIFKLAYIKEGNEVDLSDLNLKGQLLIGLKWK